MLTEMMLLAPVASVYRANSQTSPSLAVPLVLSPTISCWTHPLCNFGHPVALPIQATVQWTTVMSLPVTIENEALRVELYPLFGGKVVSIVDKADEHELLYDYATEFPTNPQYDQPYTVGYHAGWDECFPAIAPGAYPTYPYRGIGVPDHGELWGLVPVIAPIKNGIVTEWNGLRFGYRFSRRLWIDGPSLTAEYTVQNLAPFDFHFVWSQHPLLSVDVPVQLELPGGSYRLSHDQDRKQINAPYEWPTTAAGECMRIRRSCRPNGDGNPIRSSRSRRRRSCVTPRVAEV